MMIDALHAETDSYRLTHHGAARLRFFGRAALLACCGAAPWVPVVLALRHL
jgi:hypothetical protein